MSQLEAVAPTTSTRNLTPATTTMRTVLAEDRFNVQLPISERAGAPLALFANPFLEGAEECITVDADGELSYLKRSHDNGSWEQIPFQWGVAGEIKALLTAVHPDGFVWLFVGAGDNGDVHAFRLEGHDSWVRYPVGGLPGGFNQLWLHYQPDRPGTPYVIAVNAPTSNLMQVLEPYYPTPGTTGLFWDTRLRPSLNPALPQKWVAGMDPSSLMLHIYALDGTTLRRRTLHRKGGWQKEVVVATGVDEVGGCWNSLNGLGCVYRRGETLSVYAPDPGDGVSFPINSSVPLTNISVWQDERGMTHIYGLHDKVLRVIHQREWVSHLESAVEPLWVGYEADGKRVAVPFPLHGNVASYVVDREPDIYPSQLTRPTAKDGTYDVSSQDVTTSWFLDEPIRIPGSSYNTYTNYVCDITVHDGFGAPMPGLPVTLSAESSVDVRIGTGNEFVRLVPGGAYPTTTDAFGKVTVRVAARGLTVPSIRLAALGLSDGAAVDPGAGVQGFLAGTSVLGSHPTGFTASVLENAKVGDDWLVPGWHPEDGEPAAIPTPTEVVTACQNAFATAHGVERAGPPVAEEHGVQAAAWDDNFPYLSDIWQGIRDGSLTVVGFEVPTTGSATITVTAGLGKEIPIAVNLASEVEASHVVEAIFASIGAGVPRLLEWLRLPIDFATLWQTTTALDQGIRGPLESNFDVLVKHLNVDVIKPGWFIAQSETVKRALAAVRHDLTRRTVDSYQGVGEQVSGLPAALYQNSAWMTSHTAWIRDLVPATHLRIDTERLGIGGSDPGSAWAQLWNGFATSGAGREFEDSLAAAAHHVLGLWDPDDPAAAGGTRIDALLLEAIEALVDPLLELADQLWPLIVGFAQELEDSLDAILDTSLASSYSSLNTTYRWIQARAGVPESQRKDVTVGGLACLYYASALTGTFTNVTGRAPFPDGEFPTGGLPPWLGEEERDAGPGVAAPDHVRDMLIMSGLAESVHAEIDAYLDRHSAPPLMSIAIAGFEIAALACGNAGFQTQLINTPVRGTYIWAKWGIATMLAWSDVVLATEAGTTCLLTEYAGNRGSGLVSAAGVAMIAIAAVDYREGGAPLDLDWFTVYLTEALAPATAQLRKLQRQPIGPEDRVGLSLKSVLDLSTHGYSGLRQAAMELTAQSGSVTITTPAALPKAKNGQSYEVVLEATGGAAPYTWRNSGTGGPLPKGLTLNSSTSPATLAGIPADTAGKHAFVLLCFDNNRPAETSLKTFTIELSD